jgi:hypothetical protein
MSASQFCDRHSHLCLLLFVERLLHEAPEIVSTLIVISTACTIWYHPRCGQMT